MFLSHFAPDSSVLSLAKSHETIFWNRCTSLVCLHYSLKKAVIFLCKLLDLADYNSLSLSSPKRLLQSKGWERAILLYCCQLKLVISIFTSPFLPRRSLNDEYWAGLKHVSFTTTLVVSGNCMLRSLFVPFLMEILSVLILWTFVDLSHRTIQLCMPSFGSGNCNSWGQSVGINHAVGQLSVYVYSTLLPM